MTAEQIKAFQFRPEAATVTEDVDSPRFLLGHFFNLERPSDIVGVMCYGLRTHAQRPDFKVEMSTYGSADAKNNVCFGCAATSTLGMLLPDMFRPEDCWNLSWFRRVARRHVDALHRIECFFDCLRVPSDYPVWGDWMQAEELNSELLAAYAELPALDNATWEEELHKFEEWETQARAAGY